jgi:inorganic pyrophosphatase
MWDEKGPDEKILCVPLHDPFWSYIHQLSDVPQHLLKEVEHFFAVYKDLEKKKTGVEGWQDRPSALRIIREAEARFGRDQKSAEWTVPALPVLPKPTPRSR